MGDLVKGVAQDKVDDEDKVKVGNVDNEENVEDDDYCGAP